MSYSRTYQEIVSKSVSVSYNYPASDRAGTIHDVVTVDIPVTIDIDVDTSEFDHSVGTFKSNINFLQGTITGAEAAHIAAKIQSAKEVSESIVQGFYGLIQSEIGQQISEMMPRVEALTMELMQHQESCVTKQGQFGNDFNRILERYIRLFDDLDKELKNRVLSLNLPANALQGRLSQHLDRYFKSSGVIVSTVHVKERQGLTAKIVASGLKQRAVVFLSNSKKYLEGQKNLSVQFDEILEKDGADNLMKEKLPILFMQYSDVDGAVRTKLFLSEADSGFAEGDVRPQVDSIMNQSDNWKLRDPKGRDRIGQLINSELVDYSNAHGNDQHTGRVVSWIEKLWELDKESRINY